MIGKIIEFIKKLIIKILNWFKKKKNKTLNVDVKEVVKPKHVILKGSIDVVSSVIGAKNDYHELLPEDIELEIKQFIKEQKNLSSKEINKKIEEFDKKLSILKYKEENKKVQGKKSIEKKAKNLEIIKKQKTVVDKLKEESKKENKQESKDIKNSIPKIVLPAVLLDTLKGIANKKTNEETNPERIEELVIENEELEKYKSYIVDANTHLKKYKGLIKEIEEELTKNNDTLDNSKYKVLAIKSKISEIKKSYYDFKHSDYIYVIEGDYILNELDKFNIIKDSKELDNYLNKCNSILAQIEEKRYKKTEPVKEIVEQKKDEKKEEIKEKKEEKDPLLLEIEQASNIIKKDIKNQRKEINKINDKLALLPIHEQKKKRLGFFDSFLSNSFKIGISLLPIKLFRNRMLGLLTSGFMLNNSIRSMRRIINPDSETVYIEMNRRIKNQLDIINSYDTICNDSLYQISSLKEEFSRVYGHNMNDDEINKTFNKILLLEESVLEQRQNLYNTKLKLNKKVKVKVKKL